MRAGATVGSPRRQLCAGASRRLATTRVLDLTTTASRRLALLYSPPDDLEQMMPASARGGLSAAILAPPHVLRPSLVESAASDSKSGGSTKPGWPKRTF
jgi:hypothetical protein